MFFFSVSLSSRFPPPPHPSPANMSTANRLTRLWVGPEYYTGIFRQENEISLSEIDPRFLGLQSPYASSLYRVGYLISASDTIIVSKLHVLFQILTDEIFQNTIFWYLTTCRVITMQCYTNLRCHYTQQLHETQK